MAEVALGFHRGRGHPFAGREQRRGGPEPVHLGREVVYEVRFVGPPRVELVLDSPREPAREVGAPHGVPPHASQERVEPNARLRPDAPPPGGRGEQRGRERLGTRGRERRRREGSHVQPARPQPAAPAQPRARIGAPSLACLGPCLEVGRPASSRLDSPGRRRILTRIEAAGLIETAGLIELFPPAARAQCRRHETEVREVHPTQTLDRRAVTARGAFGSPMTEAACGAEQESGDGRGRRVGPHRTIEPCLGLKAFDESLARRLAQRPHRRMDTRLCVLVELRRLGQHGGHPRFELGAALEPGRVVLLPALLGLVRRPLQLAAPVRLLLLETLLLLQPRPVERPVKSPVESPVEGPGVRRAVLVLGLGGGLGVRPRDPQLGALLLGKYRAVDVVAKPLLEPSLVPVGAGHGGGGLFELPAQEGSLAALQPLLRRDRLA
mmetsp:Transcript_70490/g.159477  ORF Transcript_70490/g.159477 Transcript_70490/m.159477 type:complete len:438 (+) Transcript_70490:398-1711(+)